MSSELSKIHPTAISQKKRNNSLADPQISATSATVHPSIAPINDAQNDVATFNPVWKNLLIVFAIGLIMAALFMDSPTESSLAANESAGLINLTDDPNHGATARHWLSQQKEESLPVQTVVSQADAYEQKGLITDAHLLYFYAARKGHGQAAMKLATQSDPLHFTSAKSVTGFPEPFVAFKWYKIAQQNGIAEVKGRLQALKKWVQSQAKKGDINAERLLLQWTS